MQPLSSLEDVKRKLNRISPMLQVDVTATANIKAFILKLSNYYRQLNQALPQVFFFVNVNARRFGSKYKQLFMYREKVIIQKKRNCQWVVFFLIFSGKTVSHM